MQVGAGEGAMIVFYENFDPVFPPNVIANEQLSGMHVKSIWRPPSVIAWLRRVPENIHNISYRVILTSLNPFVDKEELQIVSEQPFIPMYSIFPNSRNRFGSKTRHDKFQEFTELNETPNHKNILKFVSFCFAIFAIAKQCWNENKISKHFF